MTKQKHFYLIRGLIREKDHWGDFPERLARSFPGSSISLIDLPGAGVNCKKKAPLSIRTMVREMREDFSQMQKLPHEEAIILSISLGGMISAQWLKDYPQDFQKAVLINTSYSGLSPILHRLRPEAIRSVLRVPFLKGRDREAHILKLITNHPEDYDSALETCVKVLETRPITLSNTLRQLFAAATFRIGTFVPKIPVYILGAAKDRMVNVECSRVIAKTWSCPIDEHPTAGHDLVLDDSEWIIEVLKKRLGT